MSAADTWLEPDEVAAMTDTKANSWAAQRRKLAKMGVPFTLSAGGRPLVERAAVLKNQAKPKAKREPNWGAVRGKAA